MEKPVSSAESFARRLRNETAFTPLGVREGTEQGDADLQRCDEAETLAKPAESLLWAARATVLYGKSGNLAGLCAAWIYCARSQLTLLDPSAALQSLYRAENALSRVSDPKEERLLRSEIASVFGRLSAAAAEPEVQTNPLRRPPESFIRTTVARRLGVVEEDTFVRVEPAGRAAIRLRSNGVGYKILRVLIEQQKRSPGESMSPARLASLAWEGDASDELSKLNRLRVALVDLRRRGLSDVIQTVNRQYRLDPSLEVVEPNDSP